MNSFTSNPAPLRDRLKAALLVYMDESALDPITKKLVEGLVKNFFKSTSDEDIRKILLHLRDDVIPVLLEEPEVIEENETNNKNSQ